MINIEAKIIQDEMFDHNSLKRLLENMSVYTNKIDGLIIRNCVIYGVRERSIITLIKENKPWYIFWRRAKVKTFLYGIEMINGFIQGNIFKENFPVI